MLSEWVASRYIIASDDTAPMGTSSGIREHAGAGRCHQPVGIRRVPPVAASEVNRVYLPSRTGGDRVARRTPLDGGGVRDAVTVAEGSYHCPQVW